MIIGDRIKDARVKKNYTQSQLGKIIGVSKVSICGYENGNRTPTMRMFIKLSKALDIPVNYMLGNDINVVAEDDVEYNVSLTREDLEIIKEIKKNKELYKKLRNDPKRTIQLIERKIDFK